MGRKGKRPRRAKGLHKPPKELVEAMKMPPRKRRKNYNVISPRWDAMGTDGGFSTNGWLQGRSSEST